MIFKSRNKNKYTSEGIIFRSLSRQSICSFHFKVSFTLALGNSLVGTRSTRKTTPNSISCSQKFVTTSNYWRRPVRIRHLYSTYASASPQDRDVLEYIPNNKNLEESTGETRKTSVKGDDNIVSASTQDTLHFDNKDILDPYGSPKN